jgi:hypothetical protein
MMHGQQNVKSHLHNSKTRNNQKFLPVFDVSLSSFQIGLLYFNSTVHYTVVPSIFSSLSFFLSFPNNDNFYVPLLQYFIHFLFFMYYPSHIQSSVNLFFAFVANRFRSSWRLCLKLANIQNLP